VPSVSRLAVQICIASFLCGSQIAHAAVPPAARQPSIFPLATRWSTEIGGPPVAGAAPLVDERYVYVALRAGQLVAHDLADGRERWRTAIVAAHPLAADAGLLFVATEDAIHALRAEDGGRVWETPAALSAPLVARGGWLVAVVDGKAIGFRAADGTKVWERALGPTTLRPFIEGDRLYLSLDDGRVVALQVTTGEVIWERLLGGVPQEPFATADRVYAGASDRFFYCLKADSGEIEWPWRIGSELKGAVAADDSLVYMVGLDNMLRAYSRKNGNQRWKEALKRRPATGPFVVGPTILVASSSSAEIWAWTPDGKSAGTIATPAEPAVPPEFVNRGKEGAFVLVVTGGLTNQWRLTLLATAGDPPLQPLSALPGEPVVLKD
jgi:outer membrane protein assembly factor BamB